MGKWNVQQDTSLPFFELEFAPMSFPPVKGFLYMRLWIHFLSDHNSFEWFQRQHTKPLRAAYLPFYAQLLRVFCISDISSSSAPNSLVILLKIKHEPLGRGF